MANDVKQTLGDIAADIVHRRQLAFKVQLSPDAVRFATDALIEGLHSNDAFLIYHGRAVDAEKKLAAMVEGKGEAVLLADLAAARNQIEQLRRQLADANLKKTTAAKPAAPKL